jgi:hypothetical protein
MVLKAASSKAPTRILQGCYSLYAGVVSWDKEPRWRGSTRFEIPPKLEALQSK